MGFMNEVKIEVQRLSKYLEHPTTVPSLWNYLVPEIVPSQLRLNIIDWLNWLFAGPEQKVRRIVEISLLADMYGQSTVALRRLSRYRGTH